jgi:hypothetical protein
MVDVIIMHIDEAPWVRGEPAPPGAPRQHGSQLIGDFKKGPWIHINSVPAGYATPKHSHGQDETLFILEGSITVGDRACGPGTVVFIRKDFEYRFIAGNKGARFLNIRPGLATMTAGGKTINPYEKLKKSGSKRE